MKTSFLIISGIAIIIVGLSALLFLDSNIFSENQTIMKSDAEILDEINRQATIHKNNDSQEKFHKQVTLMEEKIRQIASDSLEMNITIVVVDLSDPETGIGSHNFPFRDSSEIEIPKDREAFPICNIPEKIPTHLETFLDNPMFAMFAKKYSQYPTELVIMDERKSESQVHYGITAKSEDGLFTASTTFHLNTCTDEILEDFPSLFCRNAENNEMNQSSNQDDIVTSLQLEEFCIIPLDPWRNSIHEFGKKVQEKRLEFFENSVGPDNSKNIQKKWDERERLNSLRHITFLIVNSGLESDITKKKIKEYNEKFGNLPHELLELIERGRETVIK